MATNFVEVIGDSCNLFIQAESTAPDLALQFLSGAFRSAPEERRVAMVFMQNAAADTSFSLRFEFITPLFIEHTITGAPIYHDAPKEGMRV